MLKIALIGRPNVGKSSLFNSLIKSRRAVVSPLAGLTRDRHYETVRKGEKSFILIDTGGLKGEGNLDLQVTEQAEYAIAECDLICLMVSASDGLTPIDELLAMELRRSNKPLWLIVNKIDGQDQRLIESEFSTLSIKPCFYTSAVSNHGVSTLRDKALESFGHKPINEEDGRIRVTFIGRPNAGKSTLINSFLKEERLITSSRPGTTRDSISIPFSFVNRRFTLIDTAGIRRKSKIKRKVELFSVFRAFESIVLSDVVVVVCSATEGITDQDASLISETIKQGRALVIAVNKSDLITDDSNAHLERTLDRRLQFVKSAERQYISALSGENLKALMRCVVRAYEQLIIQIPTSVCNTALREAVDHHNPPSVAGRFPTLKYMCQAGNRPPSFLIYGKRTDKITDTYKRYLASYFRKSFDLGSIPIRIEFRLSE